MKIRTVIEYEIDPKSFDNGIIPDSILIDERSWLFQVLEIEFTRFTYMSNLKIKTEEIK